jgi:PKD repeat protein
MNARKLFNVAVIVLLTGMVVGVSKTASAQEDTIQCPQEMIGYWRFEEGSGPTAYDTADGNEGTLFGATWVTGQVDGALGFSGSDYVRIPNKMDLNPIEITMEAWVYPTSKGYYRAMISKQPNCGFCYPWSVYSLSLAGNTSKLLMSVAVGGQGYAVISDQEITLYDWTHVAGTYDGDTLKVYINGSLAQTNTDPSGPIDISDQPVYVGKPPSNAYYSGMLDEVAIYSTSLSAEEIQKHYQNSLRGQPYCGQAPPNQPPVADAGGLYAAYEGSDITLDASGSSDPDNNILLYEWDLDNDGEYDDVRGVTTDVSFDDDGVYTVGLKVIDEYGEFDTDTAAITVQNVAPTIKILTAPLDPIQVGTPVETSAIFSDPGVLDTHTAIWVWGDGSSAGMVDGYTVSGSHVYETPGVYTITLMVEDDDGGYATATFQYVVVYDPEGGFVTGGGWIWSPLGAYIPDDTLEGKATFGFVSKYEKGATVPTGNTEFQFHVANMNFKSTSYDWLVIAGTKTQYKGTGTINGAGEYKFMLTAIDGTPDKFRIKIWDKVTGNVIYDNQLGAEDTADPSTAIQGGSIVIHKPK